MSRPSLTVERSHTTGSVVTAAAMAVAIVLAFLGSGALGATPIQDASGGWLDTDSTLLAPAGPAFGIWSVIYLGLVIYAIWQFLPAARTSRLYRATRGWVIASALLNATWITVVQFGWLAASVVVILVLLVVLIRLQVLLASIPAATVPEHWLMWGVFGIYLGWVNVATIANAAAWLGSLGVGRNEDWTVALAVTLIVVATLIGLGTTWFNRGHLAVAAAMSWGLAWIGVSRLEGVNGSEVVSVAGFVASGMLLAAAVVMLLVLRGPRRAVRS